MKRYLFILISSMVSVIMLGQTSPIDNSFADNGVYLESVDETFHWIYSIKPIGNWLYLSGSLQKNNTYRPIVQRRDENGELDSSFGENGTIYFNELLGIPFLTGRVYDFKVQEDGKFLFLIPGVDNSEHSIYLVRLNESGELDNSFGNEGLFKFFSPDYSTIFSEYMVIGADGDIYISGRENFGETGFIMKVKSDGTLDSSYGENGFYRRPFSNSGSYNGLWATASGEIYVSGRIFNGLNNDIIITKLLSDGTPDFSFAINGELILDFDNGQDFSYDIQAIGDCILFCGTSLGKGFVGKINSTGQIDSTFGTNGFDYAENDQLERGASLVFNSYDSFLAVGGTYFSSVVDDTAYYLRFYDCDGIADNLSFFNDGEIIFQSEGNLNWGGIGVNADNDIYVGGFVNLPGLTFYPLIIVKFLGTKIISSIEDNISKNNNITIYPNPTKEEIFIDLEGGLSGDYLIEVFDSYGQIGLTRKINIINGTTLNLSDSNLKNGIYFMRISDLSSNDIQTMKIVLQR